MTISTPVVVGTGQVSASGANPNVIALTSNVDVGDTVLVFNGTPVADSTQTPSAVTDTGGNTYTALGHGGTTFGVSTRMCQRVTTPLVAGVDTISVTWNVNGSGMNTIVVKVTGANDGAELYGLTSSGSAGTSISRATGTLATANEVVFAVEGHAGGGGSPTWTAPITKLTETHASSYLSAGYSIKAAVTSTSPTATILSANSSIATFALKGSITSGASGISAKKAALSGSGPGAAAPKMATLTDIFPGPGVDGTKWQTFGTASVSGGILTLTDTAGSTTPSLIQSLTTYDLGSSYLAACLVAAGTQATSTQTMLKVTKDASNSAQFFVRAGTLAAQIQTGGSFGSQLGPVPYNAAVHKWLRIREAGGTMLFEYSTDGVAWSLLASQANPWAVTNLTAAIQCGAFATGDPQSAAQWDNVNTANFAATGGIAAKKAALSGTGKTGIVGSGGITAKKVQGGRGSGTYIAPIVGVGQGPWMANPAVMAHANGSALTSPSFAVNVGDFLVCKVSANGPDTAATPTGGRVGSWSLRVSDVRSGHASVYLWTGTVTSKGSTTVSSVLTPAATAIATMVVENWQGITPTATPLSGFAVDTQVPVFTTTAGNSVLSWMLGDWNAVDGSSRTYHGPIIAGGETGYWHEGTIETTYSYEQSVIALAGPVAFGVDAPTGMTPSIVAIEVLSQPSGIIAGSGCHLSGTGTWTPQGVASGAFKAKKPALAGTGTGHITVTGALAAKKPALSGSGTVVGPPPITGTGALAARKAALAGSGTHTFPAFTSSGALAARKAALSGTGVYTTAGTGALTAKKVKLAGTGTLIPPTAGTGSWAAKKAKPAGTAFYLPPGTGGGGIAAKKAALSGAGTVPLGETGAGDWNAKKIALSGVGDLGPPPTGITGAGQWAAKKIRLAGGGHAWPTPDPPKIVPLLAAPVTIPILWDKLGLNDGERSDGLCTVVTDVEGWYGSPPLVGNDLDRALTDGSVYGYKTVGARLITISGCAAGDRHLLDQFARALSAQAANKMPADLVILEDMDQEGAPSLTASTRADSDQLSLAWKGRHYFEYQVALTAVDPRLYGAEWQQFILTPLAVGTGTGRVYPFAPLRFYPGATLSNAAHMVNDGSAPTGVWATYKGPLSESLLTDGANAIHMQPLAAGQQIMVNTETLTAFTPGGVSRASYLMSGTTPLRVGAFAEVTWSLYGTSPGDGTGSVTIQFRGAWI